MRGKSVLLYSLNPEVARSLTTRLRASGNEVFHADDCESAMKLMAAGAVDLAVVDCPHPRHYVWFARSDERHVPIIAVARDGHPETVLELSCIHDANHVLAPRDGVLNLNEVVTTVEKILRADMFGIDKYLQGFGVESLSQPIRGTADRDDLVLMVVDYVASLGAGAEVARAMGTVVHELTTNAIFNAPERSGDKKYADLDHRAALDLEPEEYGTLRFGSDGCRFAVSVSDPFGGLSAAQVRTTLREYVKRTRRPRRPTGRGVFTVFNSCNQLIFNLSPRQRTEVIAIADIANCMRDIRGGGKSLHIFDESGEVGGAASIQLSRALRSDLRDAFSHGTPAPSRSPTNRVVRKAAPTRGDGVVEAPMQDEISGQVVSFPPETMGVDTVVGLIRGCARREGLIALGVRFLTDYYAGTVAYELRGDELTHWFASGCVHNWEQARSLPIGIRSSTTIAAIARTGTGHEFFPETPADRALAQLLAGRSDVPGLAIPIGENSQVRYLLYAYEPKYDRHIVERVQQILRDEMTQASDRLAHKAQTASEGKSTGARLSKRVQSVPPLAQAVLQSLPPERSIGSSAALRKKRQQPDTIVSRAEVLRRESGPRQIPSGRYVRVLRSAPTPRPEPRATPVVRRARPQTSPLERTSVNIRVPTEDVATSPRARIANMPRLNSRKPTPTG